MSLGGSKLQILDIGGVIKMTIHFKASESEMFTAYVMLSEAMSTSSVLIKLSIENIVTAFRDRWIVPDPLTVARKRLRPSRNSVASASEYLENHYEMYYMHEVLFPNS